MKFFNNFLKKQKPSGRLLFTAVGSRETPPDVLKHALLLCCQLTLKGWIGRSGGAHGFDTAAENGFKAGGGKGEIYLPWPGFNDHPSHLNVVCEDALEIVKETHPSGHYLRSGALKLHARNTYQVFGANMEEPDPSWFVLCWTRDGEATGGTGQAIRLARLAGIPVFNLKKHPYTVEDIYSRLGDRMLSLEVGS